MTGALEAGWWGGVGGVSLLVGALLGLVTRASQRVISGVMAAGAGVLISSVAFELMEESYRTSGFGPAALGLLCGSVVFFSGDAILSRHGGKHRKRSQHQQAEADPRALVLGALLDGIPESVAIGVSLLKGGTVSAAMVAAVFLSNVPESMASAAGMKKAGYSARNILLLWASVVLVSALSALVGYAGFQGTGGALISAIQAFAAGAILTMIASTMLPEAHESGGAVVGLLTTLGFLAAFVLSHLD